MLSRHNVKTFLFQLRCCTSALQCSVDAGLPASVCGIQSNLSLKLKCQCNSCPNSSKVTLKACVIQTKPEYREQGKYIITMSFLEDGGYFDVPIQIS